MGLGRSTRKVSTNTCSRYDPFSFSFPSQLPQPYYRLSFWNGLVFASFLILAYFTIHNIILSRIFQIYTTKLKQTAINRCVRQLPR